MSFYVPPKQGMPGQAGHDGGGASVIAGSDRLSREIGDYPEGIVLPVDKPFRWTSADALRKLKWAAIRHFGKKNLKIGHAGTLDPLATGVLLVCIGPACKQAQTLQDHDKEYIARIRFGATTPSYDLEKEPDRFFPYSHITADAVRNALQGFLGEQEQVAPLFSAKSVDGVRAYEMARKLYKARNTQPVPCGVEVPCRTAVSSETVTGLTDVSSGTVMPGPTGHPSAYDEAALDVLHRSRIVISELELLEFSEASAHRDDKGCPEPVSCHSGEESTSASSRIHLADTSALGLPEATVRIVCSKGTYIRAFARDLGEALGSGAHLAGLIRSRSGDFRLAEALTLDEALSLLSPP